VTELTAAVAPDAEAFLANLRRDGTPKRVHNMELFLDGEIKQALCERFDITAGLRADDARYNEKREIAIQRFLGYDYVHVGLPIAMPTKHVMASDTAALARADGRAFMEEHHGPITTWEEFEAYPWPDPAKASTETFEWYERNLPDDMCLVGNANAHYCEWLCWLMGYESLCYALHDQRDLVEAIHEKIHGVVLATMRRMHGFTRIKAVWGSDDMGFKTQTLISPDDTRRFVLAGHKIAAEMAHAEGWLYLVHACGNLREIMTDLIDDVKIDAKHSFEDTIESVIDAKGAYGDRCALIGGIDVDFLCRADETAIRRRVRKTLDACMPGGGYCLGSGNSVANYVPVSNYLAMIDEGRRYV